jgi:NADH-quinone oxidoreductase subunit K
MLLYFNFSILLFLIGLCGMILNRKNLILIIMSIEILLLAVNFLFILFSMVLDDFLGQIISLLILTIAAAESAIGLAILVIYYRIHGNISITQLNLLKG